MYLCIYVSMYLCIYVSMYVRPGPAPAAHPQAENQETREASLQPRSISEISSGFLGRDPGTLKSDIVSKKTSTINLFGFETLRLKIRRLKLWKPTALFFFATQTRHRSVITPTARMRGPPARYGIVRQCSTHGWFASLTSEYISSCGPQGRDLGRFRSKSRTRPPR